MNNGIFSIFNDRSILVKIQGIVALVLLLVLGSNIYTSNSMATIGDELDDVAKFDIPATEATTQIVIHQLEQAILFERALRFGELMTLDSHADKEAASTHFKKTLAAFKSLSHKVDAEIVATEEMLKQAVSKAHDEQTRTELASIEERLETIAQHHTDYEHHAVQLLDRLGRGEMQGLEAQIEKVEAEEDKLDHEIEALLGQVEQFTHAALESADHHEHAAIQNMWLAFLLSTALGLGIAFVVARRITAELRVAVNAANAMADGDFTQEIGSTSKDESGQLLDAMAVMNTKLANITRDVRQSADTLASAAEETSATTSQTNQNVQDQQSSTEQLATAMNEMSATVNEVAQSATHAAEAANKANAETEQGKLIVDQTMQGINALSAEVQEAAVVIQDLAKHSDEIGSVLGVIQGIAEQTNLLALNAAIEAARAGDQGRGFAVVADEVRTLAQRTQESTREIQGMIERLQSGANDAVKVMERGGQQADESVAQATQAGTALGAISSAVVTISDMNTQIAAAAEEQNVVADDINRNISAIHDVAAQTAEAASESVSQQAHQLQDMMQQFRA